jgi:predicted nucleotidyltransferase
MPMRLTPEQHERILMIVREHAGADAAVLLYGSRTHDDRRGGDVDLLVQSPHAIDLKRQAALHARLEEELLLPVDISFIDTRRGMTRFQKLAAAQALPLEVAR